MNRPYLRRRRNVGPTENIVIISFGINNVYFRKYKKEFL